MDGTEEEKNRFLAELDPVDDVSEQIESKKLRVPLSVKVINNFKVGRSTRNCDESSNQRKRPNSSVSGLVKLPKGVNRTKALKFKGST